MKQGRRRWTVILIRSGATRSRRVEVSSARLAVASLALGAVLVGVSVLAGRAYQARVASRAMESMQAEISKLQSEKARMAEVASRLDTLEARYALLRDVMGGNVAPSDRDVLLPAPVATFEGTEDVQAEGESERMVWPLVQRGFLTRAFGDTTAAPFEGHSGVDVAVPSGSYVRAVAAGRVLEAGEDPAYGRYLRLEHAGSVVSVYAHNSWLFAAEGDSVQAGEVIALSGNTGRSTAPHLHLEMEEGGRAVDPLSLLVRGG